MPAAMEQRLLTFIQGAFGSRLKGRELEASTPLFSSQVIDSMGVVELLAFTERELGIAVDATIEELTALDTVANLARYLAQLPRVRRES